MEIFLQEKRNRFLLKTQKIEKVEKAKNELSELIELELNSELHYDIIEGINSIYRTGRNTSFGTF
jgi:hypothetical protein